MLTQSEIVSEIVKFGLIEMGIGDPPDISKLADLSLQDMIDAVRQIELDNATEEARGGPCTFQVVPDDRLTAAVYTWLHYCAPGHHDEDNEDDAIVHLTTDGVTRGLIKWARRTA